MSKTYVVVLPGKRGNTTKDKYLVVTDTEWVRVSLGEKKQYTDIHEHDTHTEAERTRDQLNRQRLEQPPMEEIKERLGIT